MEKILFLTPGNKDQVLFLTVSHLIKDLIYLRNVQINMNNEIIGNINNILHPLLPLYLLKYYMIFFKLKKKSEK